MTTPTEALAKALAPAFGPSYFPGLTDVTIHGTSTEAVAALILAALPPGWALVSVEALREKFAAEAPVHYPQMKRMEATGPRPDDCLYREDIIGTLDRLVQP